MATRNLREILGVVRRTVLAILGLMFLLRSLPFIVQRVFSLFTTRLRHWSDLLPDCMKCQTKPCVWKYLGFQ